MKREDIHTPTRLGDKAADWIAGFIGSWQAVWLHALWFGFWFLFHCDVSLLTNIVSLEAIYLCIFLLMSQNRQSTKDHMRDDREASEVDDLFALNKQQLIILDAIHQLQQEVARGHTETPQKRETL